MLEVQEDKDEGRLTTRGSVSEVLCESIVLLI